MFNKRKKVVMTKLPTFDQKMQRTLTKNKINKLESSADVTRYVPNKLRTSLEVPVLKKSAKNTASN